jgi:hypothetical protein
MIFLMAGTGSTAEAALCLPGVTFTWIRSHGYVHEHCRALAVRKLIALLFARFGLDLMHVQRRACCAQAVADPCLSLHRTCAWGLLEHHFWKDHGPCFSFIWVIMIVCSKQCAVQCSSHFRALTKCRSKRELADALPHLKKHLKKELRGRRTGKAGAPSALEVCSPIGFVRALESAQSPSWLIQCRYPAHPKLLQHIIHNFSDGEAVEEALQVSMQLCAASSAQDSQHVMLHLCSVLDAYLQQTVEANISASLASLGSHGTMTFTCEQNKSNSDCFERMIAGLKGLLAVARIQRQQQGNGSDLLHNACPAAASAHGAMLFSIAAAKAYLCVQPFHGQTWTSETFSSIQSEVCCVLRQARWEGEGAAVGNFLLQHAVLGVENIQQHPWVVVPMCAWLAVHEECCVRQHAAQHATSLEAVLLQRQGAHLHSMIGNDCLAARQSAELQGKRCRSMDVERIRSLPSSVGIVTSIQQEGKLDESNLARTLLQHKDFGHIQELIQQLMSAQMDSPEHDGDDSNFYVLDAAADSAFGDWGHESGSFQNSEEVRCNVL